MSNIMERLDKLKTRIQEQDFLEGKGLSNEVNIHIFCYEPQDEMAIRYFVEQLVTDQALTCHVVEKNLYKIFIDLCEQKKLLKSIPGLEEKKGSDFILKQMQTGVAKSQNFVDEICKDGFEEGDVLLITGVGEAYPFIRSHDVLNAIQPKDMPNIPIVVMYPGSFDGRNVKLFNLLEPKGYYRAFNVIGQEEKL